VTTNLSAILGGAGQVAKESLTIVSLLVRLPPKRQKEEPNVLVLKNEKPEPMSETMVPPST
jgi:hypothetical protein